MTDIATASMWMTIVPVVVGGIIGLAGGLVGPWFLQNINEKTEKRKRRAEKFEELIAALFEHQHWLEMKGSMTVFGEEGEHVVSPFAKVQAIATVYFPDLIQLLDELEVVAAKYYMWMLNAGQKRVQKNIAGINEGLADAYQPYLTKFVKVVAELQAYAKREF